MKNALIIALSVFSMSAFAESSTPSNNGLNGDLIQKATAAGMTTDQAVKAVATGHVKGAPIIRGKEDKRTSHN
ncbi:hypothetical protein [Vibrio sp. LaRot3]|uniref:hypothetical protein n=1 Tax=Vibrio sp. LaRot3 TaxID=2998829 RepID=UPI0022CE1ADB|nr:hypothetical protein [Vibrio sp. LaRot3]MDA0150225.1 hypothetical protein [Vibrio sp. LaRot3]